MGVCVIGGGGLRSRSRADHQAIKLIPDNADFAHRLNRSKEHRQLRVHPRLLLPKFHQTSLLVSLSDLGPPSGPSSGRVSGQDEPTNTALTIIYLHSSGNQIAGNPLAPLLNAEYAGALGKSGRSRSSTRSPPQLTPSLRLTCRRVQPVRRDGNQHQRSQLCSEHDGRPQRPEPDSRTASEPSGD